MYLTLEQRTMNQQYEPKTAYTNTSYESLQCVATVLL